MLKSAQSVENKDRIKRGVMNTREALRGMMLCAAVILAAAGMSRGDVEPNDSMETPEKAAAGTHSGAVGGEDAGDSYAVSIKGGDIIDMEMLRTEGDEDIAIWLEDEDGAGFLALSADDERKQRWITSAEAGETTFYIEVSGEGRYSFSLAITHQDDGGLGIDAPDEQEGAPLVKPGIVKGILGDDDAYDCYRFAAKGGDVLSAALTVSGEDADVSAWIEDRDMGGVADLYTDGPAKASYVMGGEFPDRELYLVMSGTGSYEVTVGLSKQDDAGTGGDAADEAENAAVIKGGKFEGIVGGDDIMDYYAYEAAAGEEIDVQIEATAEADIELWIEDKAGGSLLELFSGDEQEGSYKAGGGVEAERVVIGVSGEGKYEFTIARRDEAEERKAAKALAEAKLALIRQWAADEGREPSEGIAETTKAYVEAKERAPLTAFATAVPPGRENTGEAGVKCVVSVLIAGEGGTFRNLSGRFVLAEGRRDETMAALELAARMLTGELSNAGTNRDRAIAAGAVENLYIELVGAEGVKPDGHFTLSAIDVEAKREAYVKTGRRG